MKKKTIIISAIIIFVLALITIVIVSNPIKLKKGSVLIEYGQKYSEPGFKAKKFGKDYTNKVKVKNNINYKKLNNYEVTYTLKIQGITYTKKRKVKIIDTKKPKITLNGNKNTNVCPKTTYNEEGYKAIDNYDKDITKKVKKQVKKDKIIYTVKDSSGNTAKKTRNLTYQDKTSPELTINQEDIKTIIVGSKYTEGKINAIDNCDGDISDQVKKIGTVDTNKIGKYKITYEVQDKQGNKTIKEKTINVVDKASLTNGIPGTIYLTFDDGPKEGTTNVILDILKEENVKATFFVTSNGPDSLIKREYDEGHTVGLHTSTHRYDIVYASDESFYQDITAVQDRVKRITGETSMIIRFPGGSSNSVSKKYSVGIMTRLTASTQEKGFKYYDWNISSGDAGGTTDPSVIYNNVVNNLKKDRANMILMHDIKPYTRDALKQIIEYGKQNGYSFEKITMTTPMITQKVNN